MLGQQHSILFHKKDIQITENGITVSWECGRSCPPKYRVIWQIRYPHSPRMVNPDNLKSQVYQFNRSRNSESCTLPLQQIRPYWNTDQENTYYELVLMFWEIGANHEIVTFTLYPKQELCKLLEEHSTSQSRNRVSDFSNNADSRQVNHYEASFSRSKAVHSLAPIGGHVPSIQTDRYTTSQSPRSLQQQAQQVRGALPLTSEQRVQDGQWKREFQHEFREAFNTLSSQLGENVQLSHRIKEISSQLTDQSQIFKSIENLATQLEHIAISLKEIQQNNQSSEKHRVQQQADMLYVKAQWRPMELEDEEVRALCEPLFSYYTRELEKQSNATVENEKSSFQQQTQDLLELLKLKSPQAFQQVQKILIKDKLLSPSQEQVMEGFDLDPAKEWSLYLQGFSKEWLVTEDNNARIPTPSNILEAKIEPTGSITTLWQEFYLRLESLIQERILLQMSEHSPSEEPKEEDPHKLFSFSDSLDHWLEEYSTDLIEDSALQEFLKRYFRMWGLEEEKVGPDAEFDASLHQYSGGGERREGEEGYLRVVKRGFRRIQDQELIRLPWVVSLE